VPPARATRSQREQPAGPGEKVHRLRTSHDRLRPVSAAATAAGGRVSDRKAQ